MFVVDLADDFFEDVFQGDKPFYAAVFIDDEGNVGMIFLKKAQEFCAGRIFGNEGKGGEDGCDILFFLMDEAVEVFLVDKAEMVVNRVFAQRRTGIAVGEKGLGNFFEGHLGSDEHDL